MLFTLDSFTILLLTVTVLPGAQSQLLNTLPRCIRDCINQSQYSDCQVTDIACLCRASSGKFLPALVNCMHDDCIDIDSNVLLAPLEFACELAGAPIPDSVLQDARNQSGNKGSGEPVTKTVTLGDDGYTSVSTATVITTADDSTQTLVYPITYDKTTTISGSPSTITAEPTESSSTASEESTSTDVTDSTSSSTATPSNATSNSTSTTEQSTTTTVVVNSSSQTVAGTLVTSTNSAESSASETTAGPPATETNSAPFQNSNGATKGSVGSLMKLGGLMFWACALF